MSDAGSGSRFPFLKRNRNDDTPSDFSQRMDLNSPVTGEINQIFTPSQPRHAAAPSDATSDFPAMPTSTEGMDENTEREYAMALAQGMSLPFVDLNEYQVDKEVISMVPTRKTSPPSTTCPPAPACRSFPWWRCLLR